MFGLRVDRTSGLSLPQQITQQIRERVLQGKLAHRDTLPPTRVLARDLGVARNVIIQAYEQLLAEGYLTSRIGSGTFVADLVIPPQHRAGAYPATSTLRREPERRAATIAFNPGLPDLRLFPRRSWARALKQACLDSPDRAHGYRSVQGEATLREALASYLWRSRGIDCQPQQLVIVSGAAQGIDLLAHLRRRHGTVVFEDPGYDHARSIFELSGLSLTPVRVDASGLCTDALPQGRCDLIYVVPSHQFPLGSVLPVRRRLALLEYARRAGALVVEDDYDSEFRYRGEPIQSLRDLAPDQVVYLGTFSKILSPGLRLGFMIVPDHLREELCRLKEDLNMRTPPIEQLALARLLADRSLDRHVFRAKKVYQVRRQRLIAALGRAFDERVRIGGESAGLHLLAEFVGRDFRRTDFDRLAERGVAVDWVEDYAWRKGSHRNRLVLGYGSLTPAQIEAGVRSLKAVVDAK